MEAYVPETVEAESETGIVVILDAIPAWHTTGTALQTLLYLGWMPPCLFQL